MLQLKADDRSDWTVLVTEDDLGSEVEVDPGAVLLVLGLLVRPSRTVERVEDTDMKLDCTHGCSHEALGEVGETHVYDDIVSGLATETEDREGEAEALPVQLQLAGDREEPRAGFAQ